MGTYQPITSITLSSTADSVTFSSIPQTFRDLVLVVSGIAGAGNGPRYEINTSTTHAYLGMVANGSSFTSSGVSADGKINPVFYGINAGDSFFGKLQVFDYSVTDKEKSILLTANSTENQVTSYVAMAKTTSVVTSLTVNSGDSNFYTAGSTFALYGIEA